MAFTQKLFTSYHPYSDGNTRIGELNRIWYDSNTNTLRIQLDSTPGGTIIGGSSNLPANANGVLYNNGTGTLNWIGLGGFVGPSGPQGNAGPSGVQGSAGAVGPTGPIGPNIPASVSQLGSVVIGANINVTPDGTISIPQNIATSSSVIFNDITVNNISVLGTSTYLIPNEVQGYRLYLATSATNTSTINTGGIVLGSSSTGVRSLLWNYNDGNDYWYTDPTTGFQTEHLIADASTLSSLDVTGQARFGTIYASTTTFSNAPARVDADVNSYAQFMIMNHSADPYASSDVVATANDGSDSSHFIDMGINGTGYSTSSWVINGAGDGYLYIDSGNLAIGTTNDNITFFVGSPETTDSIVATFTATSFNVDSINSLNSSTLSLNQGNGSVSVDSLNIPVGTILGSTTATVYTLLGLTLDQVVDYSQTSTDTLVVGEYGILNGVTAPYAVYKFIENPNPNLEVGDILSGAGIPNILPSGVLGYTGTVVLAVGTGTYSNYVVGFSDYSIYGLNPTLPTPGVPVLVGRNTKNANLSLSTLPVTDIALSPGIGGNIIVNSSIIPLTNDTYDLGSPTKRWRHVWVGAGTIYILDETLGSDTAIGARDGVVYLQGGTGLRVGEFTFKDNNITISDPARDINFGVSTATGYLHFNRPVTIQDSTGRTAFTVTKQGLTTIIPPANILSTQSALSIIGNTAGIQQPRNYNNTMLQITGLDSTSTRVSIDSFGTGTYPVIAGRQAGGTVTAPSQTVSGDTLFRISTQGWGDTGYVSAIGRMNFRALQNFTDSQAGTGIRFQLTPLNTTTIQTVTADITATGLSFVGNPIGGITFRDSTFQHTAFTSTNAVTRIFAGTGTHVSTSTGNVTVWVDLLSGPSGAQGLQGLQGTSGNNGAQGVQGLQGVNGIQGIQGTLGPKGSDGTSVRILGSTSTSTSLAFSTIDPSPTLGDGIIVTVTGHLWTYTGTGPVDGFIDVGVIVGPSGAQGNVGAQGTTGNTGATGAQGIQGTTGGTGNTGAQGIQGTTGGTGNTGAQGIQGLQGVQGIIGNIGAQGVQGLQGVQGIFGTQGTLGPSGPIGFTGLTGSQGVQGTTGTLGPSGPAGVNGVTSITAGTGTAISTSTGAVTIWTIPQAITSISTTTTSGLTVDFSGPTFITWQPSANGTRTITLTGFTPGRKVEMFITPHATNDIFTVNGVTTSQCSNGKNTFTMNGVGASQQSSFILQFYCTTNAIGGVWIYGNGSL